MQLKEPPPLDHAMFRNAKMIGLTAAAARLGVELDRQMVTILEQAEVVEPAALVRCAVDAGIRAKALRLRWKDLLALAHSGTPTLLLLHDEGAALLDGAAPDNAALLLSNPLMPDAETGREAFDEFRLQSIWTGVAIILRPGAGQRVEDGPLTIGTLIQEVMTEGALFRDIGLAALVMAFLSVAPPLLMMAVVDRVLVYQSWGTLTLLFIAIAIIALHDTLLGYAQRSLLAVAAARIDTRMSLFVMQRILRLPQDFFEKMRVGEITSSAFSVNKVQEFLTGPVFKAILDLITLLVLLPVLFWINTTLTWFVLGCAPWPRRATRWLPIILPSVCTMAAASPPPRMRRGNGSKKPRPMWSMPPIGWVDCWWMARRARPSRKPPCPGCAAPPPRACRTRSHCWPI
jgi:ATP-binding cassette, subfamily B, bacterial HlyB/CyaB